ncbi:uncharacterized protein LOC142629848 [Castanea sativa]|uniref:uncharacterized protein LOC142629848 n=1 Tax=Castanea sativa TaxID=21020 RepID=UPI003F64BA32
MKLEFPRFCGEEPASWIYKANQYFKYYRIPKHEKLMMASFHMDGEALVWFQEGEDAGVFGNWEALVQALLIRFRSTTYDDPMEPLTRLRQTSIVAMYKGEFKVLSNRIKGLSPTHKLSCFLSGLKDKLTEIEDGVTTAKVQEEEVEAEITLYALVGSPTPITMRVKGKIKTISLVILVDSGSTHNFIDASLIPGLQIPVDVSQILEVKVANGEIIKTQGLCKDVLMFIHGQIFFVQLHVLSLGGCDLLMGT